MADRPDPLRDDGTTWQEQVPILERLQAWTQVKSEQPCQSHRDVGVSVRIDCKLGSLKTLIAHDAFDGSAGLALVEHHGLSIGDAQRSRT